MCDGKDKEPNNDIVNWAVEKNDAQDICWDGGGHNGASDTAICVLWAYGHSQRRVPILHDELRQLATAPDNHHRQTKDIAHLRFRHSPAIEDSKIHGSPTRGKALPIPWYRVSRTVYMVCLVQQDFNGKMRANMVRSRVRPLKIRKQRSQSLKCPFLGR